MYMGTKFKKTLFLSTKVTRSNISFAKGNQYPVVRLKQSKTNTEHTGIQIIFTTTGEKTYLVAALKRFYILDP